MCHDWMSNQIQADIFGLLNDCSCSGADQAAPKNYRRPEGPFPLSDPKFLPPLTWVLLRHCGAIACEKVQP